MFSKKVWNLTIRIFMVHSTMNCRFQYIGIKSRLPSIGAGLNQLKCTEYKKALKLPSCFAGNVKMGDKFLKKLTVCCVGGKMKHYRVLPTRPVG